MIPVRLARPFECSRLVDGRGATRFGPPRRGVQVPALTVWLTIGAFLRRRRTAKFCGLILHRTLPGRRFAAIAQGSPCRRSCR